MAKAKIDVDAVVTATEAADALRAIGLTIGPKTLLQVARQSGTRFVRRGMAKYFLLSDLRECVEKRKRQRHELARPSREEFEREARRPGEVIPGTDK